MVFKNWAGKLRARINKQLGVFVRIQLSAC